MSLRSTPYITPLRTWKKLLDLDGAGRGGTHLSDAEFEAWVEEMHAALLQERCRREERCESCGCSMTRVVGPAAPGQRFEVVICTNCHPEVLEDYLEGRES